MRRSATAFVAIWCVLSVMCAFIIFHLTSDADTKISQFVLLNAVVMVGLGVFFAVYRNKISLLLENYKREKEI